MSATLDTAEKHSKKPKYTKLTQQELPACKASLTPISLISIFTVIGVAFIPIGYFCLRASQQVVEASQRYDDICLPGATALEQEQKLLQMNGTGSPCSVTLTVPRHMSAPVFLYYELDNFYQNHRRYVNSRSDAQLRGASVSSASLHKSCDPQATLNGSAAAIIEPCGLVAWSYFNDTFQVSLNGSALVVDDAHIAWRTDVDKRFTSTPATNFNTVPELRGGGTISGPIKGDEHFIVWMRTAALRNFRKLLGRIDADIPAGASITIDIQNRYNTYAFGGKKKVVLSTASWLGGANPFLGIAYFGVGGASLAFALAFLVLTWLSPRQAGDNSQLSWNKNK
ncbi:ALA-interacting subunit 1 [Coccomyxa sp. Obi]|nr:ALA-interacting subunit 1 [Coccomyxa sp. Obi]